MLERIEPQKHAKVYKPKDPFIARLIKNEKLLSDTQEDDTRHLVFEILADDVAYVDGQSIGIIHPGVNEKGKKHRVRLYSIASCSHGDNGDNKTFSLCVKRVEYKDESNTLQKGLCSNYLCDLKVGDEVHCSGPSGKLLSMPKDDNTKLIMLATGTGIAPFRGFLEKIYKHKHQWRGGITLYFGGKSKEDAYYMNSVNDEITQFANDTSKDIDFTIKTAFSREEKNAKGERKYIQDLLQEDIKELFDIFEEGNFALYVCGLKGIVHGIDEVFSNYAKEQGKDWNEMKHHFREDKRWNIEVY